MSVKASSQLIEQAVMSKEVYLNQAASETRATAKAASPRVEISLPELSKKKDGHSDDVQMNDAEFKSTLDAVAKMLKSKEIDLNWRVDVKTNSIIIKFIERGSNRLIRQIPPEEILRLREHISEILGMIYDTKV